MTPCLAEAQHTNLEVLRTAGYMRVQIDCKGKFAELPWRELLPPTSSSLRPRGKLFRQGVLAERHSDYMLGLGRVFLAYVVFY